MLHAHLPEDIRHFAKHLFATFLGLLMALGLEQWAERQRDKRMAHEFMERVHEDLVHDLDYAHQMTRVFNECAQHDQIVITQVRALLEARKHKRPARPIDPKGQFREDLFFASSAWDAAKASGTLQHVPPKVLQDLSSVFESFKRIEQMDTQFLTTPAVSSFAAHFHDDWNLLDDRELESILEGLYCIRGYCTNWEHVCAEITAEVDPVRKELEEALRH
jgi:hypothetical protein